MIYYPVLRPGTRGTSRAVWRTLPVGIGGREVGHRAASCQLLPRGCPCCPKGRFCFIFSEQVGPWCRSAEGVGHGPGPQSTLRDVWARGPEAGTVLPQVRRSELSIQTLRSPALLTALATTFSMGTNELLIKVRRAHGNSFKPA